MKRRDFSVATSEFYQRLSFQVCWQPVPQRPAALAVLAAPAAARDVARAAAGLKREGRRGPACCRLRTQALERASGRIEIRM